MRCHDSPTNPIVLPLATQERELLLSLRRRAATEHVLPHLHQRVAKNPGATFGWTAARFPQSVRHPSQPAVCCSTSKCSISRSCTSCLRWSWLSTASPTFSHACRRNMTAACTAANKQRLSAPTAMIPAAINMCSSRCASLSVDIWLPDVLVAMRSASVAHDVLMRGDCSQWPASLVGCRGLFLASGVLPLHRSPGLRWRPLLRRVVGCAAAATVRTRPHLSAHSRSHTRTRRSRLPCIAFCVAMPGGATSHAHHSLTPPCSSLALRNLQRTASGSPSSRPLRGWASRATPHVGVWVDAHTTHARGAARVTIPREVDRVLTIAAQSSLRRSFARHVCPPDFGKLPRMSHSHTPRIHAPTHRTPRTPSHSHIPHTTCAVPHSQAPRARATPRAPRAPRLRF